MRMRGIEPPRGFPHTDLNRARLPIPPHPRSRQDSFYPFAECRPADNLCWARLRRTSAARCRRLLSWHPSPRRLASPPSLGRCRATAAGGTAAAPSPGPGRRDRGARTARRPRRAAPGASSVRALGRSRRRRTEFLRRLESAVAERRAHGGATGSCSTASRSGSLPIDVAAVAPSLGSFASTRACATEVSRQRRVHGRSAGPAGLALPIGDGGRGIKIGIIDDGIDQGIRSSIPPASPCPTGSRRATARSRPRR